MMDEINAARSLWRGEIYNMSPADRSQCHRQPHHHREVRDYPDTPLRFQIFIFKMFVIFIYICTILVQTFIKCWNLECLVFPDVPALVIQATFELRAKKDESPEVLGQEEEASLDTWDTKLRRKMQLVIK